MPRIASTAAWLVIVIGGTANAAEDQMVVNEVLVSVNGNAQAQFIELFDSGDQDFPNNEYKVEVYNADASVAGITQTTGIMGGNGPRFYVLSSPEADAALGITGDAPLTNAIPVDGQACFIGTAERKIHCIAWGCVTTKITPATPIGASPPDGMSLQRTPSGAVLTVDTPTPAAANRDGTMDDPCPIAPMPDGAPIGEDPGGGCCDGSGGSGIGAGLMLGILWLGARKRRPLP